jgi:hypothetical protein
MALGLRVILLRPVRTARFDEILGSKPSSIEFWLRLGMPVDPIDMPGQGGPDAARARKALAAVIRRIETSAVSKKIF